MNGSAFDVLPVSQNEAPSRIRKRKHLIKRFALCLHYCILTLDYGIDLGQGIYSALSLKTGLSNKAVGHGKNPTINERRAYLYFGV